MEVNLDQLFGRHFFSAHGVDTKLFEKRQNVREVKQYAIFSAVWMLEWLHGEAENERDMMLK